MSRIDTYFNNLLEILRRSSNLSYQEKNVFWLTEYKLSENHILNSDINNLNKLMPLVHPDFLYDAFGNFLGDIVKFNDSSFNSGINETARCQINLIQKDCSCQFNSYRDIRGKCQADHFWPHSLGGPSIFDNRILLCRYHNVSKSNSIVEEFWNSYPTWLNDYLLRLFNLKN